MKWVREKHIHVCVCAWLVMCHIYHFLLLRMKSSSQVSGIFHKMEKNEYLKVCSNASLNFHFLYAKKRATTWGEQNNEKKKLRKRIIYLWHSDHHHHRGLDARWNKGGWWRDFNRKFFTQLSRNKMHTGKKVAKTIYLLYNFTFI